MPSGDTELGRQDDQLGHHCVFRDQHTEELIWLVLHLIGSYNRVPVLVFEKTYWKQLMESVCLRAPGCPATIYDGDRGTAGDFFFSPQLGRAQNLYG